MDNRALTITTFKHLKWILILIFTFYFNNIMTRKIILSAKTHYFFPLDLFYLSKFLEPVINLFLWIIFPRRIGWEWQNSSLPFFLRTKTFFQLVQFSKGFLLFEFILHRSWNWLWDLILRLSFQFSFNLILICSRVRRYKVYSRWILYER